jgi:4-hydroxy-2-oxoheptanedioate aldolase
MGCARVRQLLDEDKPAWGVFVSIAAPAIVEIAGHAGYDFAVVDMEHTSIDFPAVENMIRAGNGVGISVIVRVPENNHSTILRVADIGADGIIIPHVRNAQDVQRAVDAAKYQPLGQRGILERCRAADYGVSSADFIAFTRKANHDLLLIALIEEASAVDDIEAIASVDGLDVCFMAPSDLSSSLGCIGTRNAPQVDKAVRHVADTVRRIGKAKFGIPAFHGALELDCQTIVSLGGRLISVGQDAGTLLAGFRGHMARTRAKP